MHARIAPAIERLAIGTGKPEDLCRRKAPRNLMRGTAKRLPVPLRAFADVAVIAAGIPTFSTQRVMHLGALVQARQRLRQRPPWPGIFIKAYAQAAQDLPVLRQVYVPYPWPHLYQYESSVACLAVGREEKGESFSFGLPIKDPCALSLDEISRRIGHAASAPLQEIGIVRHMFMLARLPWFVRRPLLRVLFNIPRPRARYLGTFGLSAFPSLGAELVPTLSMWTTLLTYGLFAPDGKIMVRLACDHRIINGVTAARALTRLEEVLTGPILTELQQMHTAPIPDAAQQSSAPGAPGRSHK